MIGWLVGGGVVVTLSMAFGWWIKEEIKEGNKARALLSQAYEEIVSLKKENAKLRSPLTSPSERQSAARAELDLRNGMREDGS